MRATGDVEILVGGGESYTWRAVKARRGAWTKGLLRCRLTHKQWTKSQKLCVSVSFRAEKKEKQVGQLGNTLHFMKHDRMMKHGMHPPAFGNQIGLVWTHPKIQRLHQAILVDFWVSKQISRAPWHRFPAEQALN